LLGSIWLAVRAVRRFSATVRQAEELQRLTSGVFANALEGIIVTDGDSRIITANQAMCAMTGYGLDELIGQTPALFRSDVHDDAFFSAFWDHLRTNGRWQGEIWNRRKSGEVVPELLSVSAISEGGVGGSAYIGVYTDISAAKAAQRKMEFSYAELSRLAEVMAHHLQEPSRLLVTFAQRLRKSEDARALGPESIASLEFIEQQAGRLRALIRDIQLYLAAAQPTPEPEPCPLAQAIRNVVSRRAGLLAAIGAEVVVPGELPAVAVDGRRLHELFDILLDNAIRYRRGEVPLRVEVAAAAKDGMVEVRFSDNGPGIEPRYRELVFRVFERLDHGPGEEGTGIGLAIVRRIVEHGNGSVWIEDTVGGGTTVVLDLPMGRPA
ncbi:MAG: sensor histidine kinase, partial [Actinomycetota bacterium]